MYEDLEKRSKANLVDLAKELGLGNLQPLKKAKILEKIQEHFASPLNEEIPEDDRPVIDSRDVLDEDYPLFPDDLWGVKEEEKDLEPVQEDSSQEEDNPEQVYLTSDELRVLRLVRKNRTTYCYWKFFEHLIFPTK